MKITATRDFRYGGKDRRIGETFEASTKDAKILRAIRKAKPAELGEDAPAPPRQRNTRVPRGRAGEMQFQSAPVAAVSGEQSVETAGGTYNRRDMRAED